MLSIVYLIVLAASLLLILVVVVAVVFTTPIAFGGNIVKLRAQYTPKVLQLDPKNGKDALAGKSVAKSYWGILKRVYRLEGWRGLLKGIVPLSFMTVTQFALLQRTDLLPPLNPVLAICRSAIFLIPAMILESRTITTREMLSFFDVRRAIRVLFSPAERRQPWLLYLTPGVLPVALLQLACGHLVQRIHGTVTGFVVDRELFYGVSTLTLVRLGCVILRTMVATPLQVIGVRLVIQRNLSAVSLGRDRPDIGSEKLAERLTTEEQVLHLRTDLDLPPYTGVWDCARCIINEEGFWVLYRTWWYTSFLLFLNTVVS